MKLKHKIDWQWEEIDSLEPGHDAAKAHIEMKKRHALEEAQEAQEAIVLRREMAEAQTPSKMVALDKKVLSEKDQDIEILLNKIDEQKKILEHVRRSQEKHTAAEAQLESKREARHTSYVHKPVHEKEKWLQNNPMWIADDKKHRSKALADVGLNGPASNLLKQEGQWNAADATRSHWVIFDMQQHYSLSKIEMKHVTNQPETPRECKLEGMLANGTWIVAHKWTADYSTGTEIFDFPVEIAQFWRLTVNNTYGTGSQGAIISSMRFFGKRALSGEHHEMLPPPPPEERPMLIIPKLPVKTYTEVKCGVSTVGRHLNGSGKLKWKGLDDAIKQCEGAYGHTLGRTCRYIQEKDGMLYFYAFGSDNGESGQECWRFNPIE